MSGLCMQAFAKINLCLDILGIRPDGYHEVRMIMQQLSLFDTVSIRKTDEPGIRLFCSDPALPTDSRNLMVQAAERVYEHCGIQGGLRMELQKNIPAAAGLAGGSADAAAVIVLMNRLYELGLSGEEMQKIGLRVGADVPYCIYGGTALSSGIGEKLTPLPPCPSCGILLVKPEKGASTREIYSAWDALSDPFRPDVDAGIEALRKGDLGLLAKSLGNSLEPVTRARIPVIGEIREAMLSCGAEGAVMSGSGPTVFGLFPDIISAEKAGETLKEQFPDCFVSCAEPVNRAQPSS